MKTILLTGGTGFLGPCLALKFLNDGVRIIFLARSKKDKSATERVIEALRFTDQHFSWNQDMCEVIEGDVTEPLPRIKGIDRIIHCAALLSFDERERGQILKVNHEGTKNMLDFALRSNVPEFGYISTAYIFGDKREKGGKIFEDEFNCDQKFFNSYEESKFLAEGAVRNKAREIKISIFRPSIVIVNSLTGLTSSFTGFYTVYRSLHSIKERETKKTGKSILSLPINFFCNPRSWSNLVPVDWVANTIFLLTTRDESVGKTFHIVNESPPTFKELTESTLGILGIKDFNFFDVVNPPFVPSRQKDRLLKAMEDGIRKEWKPYTPYISLEELFDCWNVKNVLGDSYTPCPSISGDLLKVILEYARKENFGRKEIKNA